MEYIWDYQTPEGFDDLALSGDEEALTGLWFVRAPGDRRRRPDAVRRQTAALRETCRWLDAYFAGREPDFAPPCRLDGLSAFRRDVLDEIKRIPYGATVSYGEIAKALSRKRGGRKVSARAVGGAVGKNPIALIIPCHRVVGADGDLTGYSGGLGNKVSLLAHEGSDLFDVRLLAPKKQGRERDEKFLRRCRRIVDQAAALHGLGPARCAKDGGASVICLDGLERGGPGFAAPFIFDACGDEEAKTLLESFIECPSLYHDGLKRQLARLLARKGSLVKRRAGRAIRETDWSKAPWAKGLLLAALAARHENAALLLRLLDEAGDAARDGLYIACWHARRGKVQKRLKEMFETRLAEDPAWGEREDDVWWVGAFLAKWTKERTFDYGSLQTLTQGYFSRQAPFGA